MERGRDHRVRSGGGRRSPINKLLVEDSKEIQARINSSCFFQGGEERESVRKVKHMSCSSLPFFTFYFHELA